MDILKAVCAQSDVLKLNERNGEWFLAHTAIEHMQPVKVERTEKTYDFSYRNRSFTSLNLAAFDLLAEEFSRDTVLGLAEALLTVVIWEGETKENTDVGVRGKAILSMLDLQPLKGVV